ncbi:hypothetical protein M514_23663 [Trichuris suis]|uniref:Uncharacterized protein n=1 Tax=Trichuris suis TaxID=68888 RepID=A0A085N3X8_9BILA|nr:hypothetical protein M514_23663 [Trichuris suis]
MPALPWGFTRPMLQVEWVGAVDGRTSRTLQALHSEIVAGVMREMADAFRNGFLYLANHKLDLGGLGLSGLTEQGQIWPTKPIT